MIELQSIDAIFFDVDNTLLNHSKAEQTAFEQTCIDCGIVQLKEDLSYATETYKRINEELWNAFRNNKLQASDVKVLRFELLCKELLATPNQSTEYIAEYYLSLYEQYWELMPFANHAIEFAKAHTAKVGLITNGFVQQQRNKIARFSWENVFTSVVISGEVGVSKPHPHIFARASELAMCSAERCLYVGDHFDVDIVGAHNAGWKSVWFQNAESTARTSGIEASATITSLKDFHTIFR